MPLKDRIQRLAYLKEWRRKHPDYDSKRSDKAVRAERLRLWRQDDPNRFRLYEQRRYTKHKEQRITLARAVSARHRGAEGTWNTNDVRRLWWFQKGFCMYCTTRLDSHYHVDHMTPLVRGGTNWPSNICLTCPGCNRRKYQLTAAEFYLQLEASR